MMPLMPLMGLGVGDDLGVDFPVSGKESIPAFLALFALTMFHADDAFIALLAEELCHGEVV